jgi:hypothetical protein
MPFDTSRLIVHDSLENTPCAKQNGVESLSCKLSLVSHVLQLVVQLLRVEAVVPVRQLPNRVAKNNCDSEDDDCDDDSDDDT